jgi:AraC-like DNA-binding protein
MMNDLNLVLLNAGYAVHHADWNWQNVNSPFMRLYQVTRGEARVMMNGTEHRLSAGYLYLIPPFTLHSNSCDGDFELCYFHIYEMLPLVISVFEQMHFPFETAVSKTDELLVQRLLDINPNRELKVYDPATYDNTSHLFHYLAAGNSTLRHLSIETSGIILQLFSRFYACATPNLLTSDSRILKAVRYIREHIDEKLSVTDLAGQASLTVDHFIRLFRQQLNVTPLDYINRKKIEKAQLMLVINNSLIKDIAYSLAFDNISYFNRIFKSLVGQTPVEYRRHVMGASNVVGQS